MPSALALTPAPTGRLGIVPDRRSARVALYADPAEPPVVETHEEADLGRLVEGLVERVGQHSTLPLVAVREVIENLVHADFADALVSLLDGGRLVRVSDRGPGIPDKALAREPGYSTAGPREREVIRAVGSGLAVASALLEAAGGMLELDDNLDGGTVATLRSRHSPPLDAAPPTSELSRRLLALLVELAPAEPQALATELAVSASECGRELALLEHRGLVARASDGRRTLTDAGTSLIATLF